MDHLQLLQHIFKEKHVTGRKDSFKIILAVRLLFFLSRLRIIQNTRTLRDRIELFAKIEFWACTTGNRQSAYLKGRDESCWKGFVNSRPSDA